MLGCNHPDDPCHWDEIIPMNGGRLPHWDDALNGFSSDGRIGDSHLNVPGHDGKLGYGGTCFPKDVKALLIYAQKLGINLNTIRGGWETNLQVRDEKDWESNFGRSVSFKLKK